MILVEGRFSTARKSRVTCFHCYFFNMNLIRSLENVLKGQFLSPRWVNGRREGPGKMVLFIRNNNFNLDSDQWAVDDGDVVGVEHGGGVRRRVEEQPAARPGQAQVLIPITFAIHIIIKMTGG